MDYSVKALVMGTFTVPGPEVYWMHHWDKREKMHTLMYLVRGGGQNVIINTGPPQDLSVINQAWREFFGFDEAVIVRQEEERPQNALAAHGLRPEDIDVVIITPLQAYATANIHLFRNAQVCISRKGWIEDFQAPHYHLHVARHLRVPPEVNNYLQNEGWEKLRLLADEDEIVPGITTFWAGVHHRSSIAVCIETAKGKVIITDAFFKFGNIEQGHYLGVMESMMEADATYKRLRKEGDIVLSIYDPEIFERYPGGEIA